VGGSCHGETPQRPSTGRPLQGVGAVDAKTPGLGRRRPWGEAVTGQNVAGPRGHSGVSSCSSACGARSMGPGSDASLSNAGRRRARGRWNERRLCTRRAAADRACALSGARRSGPAPGSREDCDAGPALSGGTGLGARGRRARSVGGCMAAGGPRRGDELPVSGVSEPVSPAGRPGVSGCQAPLARSPDSHWPPARTIGCD
jgi:hypothetical protein